MVGRTDRTLWEEHWGTYRATVPSVSHPNTSILPPPPFPLWWNQSGTPFSTEKPLGVWFSSAILIHPSHCRFQRGSCVSRVLRRFCSSPFLLGGQTWHWTAPFWAGQVSFFTHPPLEGAMSQSGFSNMPACVVLLWSRMFSFSPGSVLG